MRLFIATQFDDEVKDHIQAVQERLRRLDSRANFTRRENLHLTLAFLGEISEERLADIEEAMNAVETAPLELCFDRMGRFRRRDSELWWIGARGNRELERMQAELTARLRSKGFSLEERTFQPHLTLAREVRLTRPPDRAALLGNPFAAHVDAMSLIRSQRLQGRLIYTELFRR